MCEGNNKTVYSIVLNWNNIDDTEETVNCLLNQSYLKHKLILVDNNSEENIYNTLMKKYPQIIHIRNSNNLGYTGGNNIGIKYALENKADIIILANNDLYIDDKNLISKLVYDLTHYNQIAILGTSLNFFMNKNEIQQAGTTILKSDKNKYRVNDYLPNDLNINNNLKYFDGVPGAFMAVKSDVFEKIGLLDEDLFMYGDETDLCYRAWKEKLGSAVNNSLIVYHKGGGIKSRLSPRITYYKTRNTLYFLFKHKSTIKYYKYFLFQFHYFFLSNLWRLILIKGNNRKLMYASIKGIADAWFNKMGKRY